MCMCVFPSLPHLRSIAGVERADWKDLEFQRKSCYGNSNSYLKKLDSSTWRFVRDSDYLEKAYKSFPSPPPSLPLFPPSIF